MKDDCIFVLEEAEAEVASFIQENFWFMPTFEARLDIQSDKSWKICAFFELYQNIFLVFGDSKGQNLALSLKEQAVLPGGQVEPHELVVIVGKK